MDTAGLLKQFVLEYGRRGEVLQSARPRCFPFVKTMQDTFKGVLRTICMLGDRISKPQLVADRIFLQGIVDSRQYWRQRHDHRFSPLVTATLSGLLTRCPGAADRETFLLAHRVTRRNLPIP